MLGVNEGAKICMAIPILEKLYYKADSVFSFVVYWQCCRLICRPWMDR